MDRKNTKAVFHSRDETYVFLWTYSQFQVEQSSYYALYAFKEKKNWEQTASYYILCVLYCNGPCDVVVLLCVWTQQQEQTEWDAVNRLLQHHGFKPVHFADPVENKNLAGNGLVCFCIIFLL